MDVLYKTRFNARAEEIAGSALLAQIEAYLRQSAQARFDAPLRETGEWSQGDEQLTIERGESGDSSYFVMSSTLRSELRLRYQLATTGDAVENVVEIQQLGNFKDIARRSFSRPTPRIVQIVTKHFDCDIDGEGVGPCSTRLTKPDIERFIEEDIFGDRKLPIVVMSRSIGKQLAVDPDETQRRLIGVARVFDADAATANALLISMSDKRCRRLACYGGAVRLYKPNCTPNAPSRDHRVWMPDRVSNGIWRDVLSSCRIWLKPESGGDLYDRVYKAVRNAQYEELKAQFEEAQERRTQSQRGIESGQDSREKSRVRSRELQSAMAELETRNREIRNVRHQLNAQEAANQTINEKLELADSKISQLEEQLKVAEKEKLNALDQLEITKTENCDLYDELEQKEEEFTIFQLLAELGIKQAEALKDEQSQFNRETASPIGEDTTLPHYPNNPVSHPESDFDGEEIVEDEIVEPIIDSVRDAVELAQRELEGLRFLPSAIKEARKSQFKPASKVYRTFKHLDEAAGLRIQHNDDFGTSLTDLFKQVGIDYVYDESESTSKKLADTRYFYDREKRRRRYMSEHIRIGGNQLRIHLTWDKSEKRWLIGHVGRHLETSRN